MKKKLTKKETQFLVQKYADSWAEANVEMIKDMEELCADAVFFKMKWGCPVKMVLDEAEPQDGGRQLGVGAIEKLFNAQEFTNKKL